MCTAYELGKRGGSFPEFLQASAIEELLAIREMTIIRPTLQAPVILPDGRLAAMSWGFRREFAGKTKGRKIRRSIVNSREDKLSSHTWREAFQERRCIIPATAFFEWIDIGGNKRPFRFARTGDGWLWIAGIWEDHREHGLCFSMITTESNEAVKIIHDRMPAVLEDGQIASYFAGELHRIGPSTVNLEFSETVSPLRAIGDWKSRS